MSIQSLIIIPKHLDIDEVGGSITSAFGGKSFKILPRYNANHKLIELTDSNGTIRQIDVFLNSYAADDYATVYSGDSTLIALPFDPIAWNAMERLSQAENAISRKHDGAEWVQA